MRYTNEPITNTILMQPFVIYHDRTQRVEPLFAELEKRGIPYHAVNAAQHFFAVEEKNPAIGLFFNCINPADSAQHTASGSFYTLNYLKHLEHQGVRVINGYRAFTYETSKALQLILLQQLDLKYPKTRVVNHISQLEAAAAGLLFPIIVKQDTGSVGTDHKFNSPEQLLEAINQDVIHFGINNTLLLQEYIPVRNGYVTRVETLGGKYLYAISRKIGEQQTGEGKLIAPPAEVIRHVESIVQQCGIDAGNVEYIIDDRSDDLVYNSISTINNFMLDTESIEGFNPYERLAEFLEEEAVKKTEDIAVV